MAKVKIQGHASGTGVITLTAPNTSTDRTVTLPDADVTLGASPVTALNNATANELVTVGSTTTELDAESALTYDGTTFLLTQASPILKILPTTNGNDGVIELCGRSTDGTPTENRTQIKGEAEGSTANTKMTFHTENASGVNERLVITSDGRGVSEFTAKAWVNFNGEASPLSVNDSHNVSSVTDDGVGKYTVNFGDALGNANYSVAAQTEDGGGYNDPRITNHESSQARSTTAYGLYHWHISSAALDDATKMNVIVFGD